VTASGPTVLVLAAKSVRTFAYGALGVVFPLHLAALGLGPEAIGGAVTATLASSALLTLAVRRPVERLGPRPVLLALAGLTTAAGVLFVTTHSVLGAIAAAMLGNLAVSAGETGPFLSIEQVLLAGDARGSGLTRRMTAYNVTGYAAAGAGALAVALGFAALAGNSLSMIVKEKYGTQFQRPWATEHEGRWNWLLLGRDGRLFLTLVAGVTGQVELVLAYIAVGTHLHAGARIVRIRAEASRA
jgi:MFS family permease